MTEHGKGTVVQSTVGDLEVDAQGSPVGVVKMDPLQAYVGIPELLQSFIDKADLGAWERIKTRIDYLFQSLDQVLSALNREHRFDDRVKAQVKGGKKLLFKPNIVSPMCIDPTTHGEGRGNIACTQWAFIAALMRWFHDNLGISYNEMSLGEAGTAVTMIADAYTKAFGKGKMITPEAVLEGRSGDFYGGWGFYFARKYLAERHQAGHADDPLNGYAESVAGEYFPPGKAGSRLMVYDLNRVMDTKSRGRDVPVPDGSYFKEITLHKAVVGGNPNDPEDLRGNPGCVLINVPRLKVHNRSLFTNAIKNLGIGLYPMGATVDDVPQSTLWKYSFPLDPSPRLKYKVPHFIWFPELDQSTGHPRQDEKGEYVVAKTSGLTGVMVDIVKAVLHQGIFMLHVVDAVEAINVSHDTATYAMKVPEGYAFAAIDPVALDLLCARYMFKMVPLAEARILRAQGKMTGDFVQRVPVPQVDGTNIVAGEGFDAPIARYNLFDQAEQRGLGQQRYYVTGWDKTTDNPLASIQGHLGRIEGHNFRELITTTMYYDIFKLLWDLQATVLGYVRASDHLTGSSYCRELLEAFDENGDGVVDYDETGKNRFGSVAARLLSANGVAQEIKDPDPLRQALFAAFRAIKTSNEKCNGQGEGAAQLALAGACEVAFDMAQAPVEAKDPLFPTITWGKGKWPSLQHALQVTLGRIAFGPEFPAKASLTSLYGQAFLYADKALDKGRYTGSLNPTADAGSLERYLAATVEGARPLDFVLYVPKGLNSTGKGGWPNVAETSDPAKVFTAAFNGGKDTW